MLSTRPRLVLVHGAATTSRIWDPLLPYLDDWRVDAPERPRTGDLARETAWLSQVASGAWVVGVSGGATLGLSLAATSAPLAGALLHEPAVGSLLPGLLAPFKQAFTADGTRGLGKRLYGPTWTEAMAAGITEEVTAGELAMFGAFEPAPRSPTSGRVLVTWGAQSPDVRRRAAQALLPLDYPARAVAGLGHFAPHDRPALFAETIRRWVSRSLAD